MTIGETADLKAATFDDVREFFRTYYHPSNASLVVAGDVDTADALERVRAHFEEIPPGPVPVPLEPLAELTEERRLLLEDRIELPRLYLAWHSPAMFTDGDAEMDLLSDLFANGKVSRLYKSLVYERRIASEVMAFQNSRELAGFWQVVATAAPGHSLEAVQQAIDEELDQADRRRADGGRDRARARTDRSAVRLPTADARRVRRKSRSAERLFGVPQRSWILRTRSGALRGRHRLPICITRVRNTSSQGQPRGVERRAERQAVACAAALDAGGGVMSDERDVRASAPRD